MGTINSAIIGHLTMGCTLIPANARPTTKGANVEWLGMSAALIDPHTPLITIAAMISVPYRPRPIVGDSVAACPWAIDPRRCSEVGWQ